ncbi:MAG: glycosyltransferase family 2 protein [Candidatus Pacebacteria bacterium]|nr:glycosyltransferase family 2 protein [Candidatus Paceibacterota bacterium]
MVFNNNPLVSVIIPTYNRARLLKRSVGSVLNQTFQDFEIIIIDDGSTDNTESIIKSFSDPRIKYIKNEKNIGANAARNIGIKISKGKYIAFQDSDDEWLTNKLEKQIRTFETASLKVGVVYTGRLWIKNGKKIYIPLKRVKQKEGNIHKELYKSSFITTSVILVKKECFKKSKVFDENLPRFQDWDLVLKLSRYYEFKFIDEPLSLSYHTQNSISTNSDALIKAFEIIKKKHFKELNNKLLAKHYFRIGNILCSSGELKQGRGYFIRSIRLDPLNISLVIFFFSFLNQKYFSKFENTYIRIRESLLSIIEK